MYGMVNKAVEDMVCATYGEAMWEKVKEQAGVVLFNRQPDGCSDAMVRMRPDVEPRG